MEPSEYTIFEECLALDPADVPAFFDAQCGSGTPLRSRMNEMWQAHIANLSTGSMDFDAEMPRDQDVVGRRLGRYTVRALLGEGAAGRVVKATRDDRPDQFFAIKVLRLAAQTSEGRSRFENEVAALRRLDHPGIAGLIEHGTAEEGSPYLVMPFVAGTCLSDVDVQAVPFARRCEWMRQICDAVVYAHQHLLLHRDLKPGNIILTENGPIVTDFGLAKSIDDSQGSSPLTGTGQVLGTPQFMAPEQVSGGNDHTVATDVFGLGAVFYFVLTGRPPFEARTLTRYAAEVLDSLPVSPQKHVPAIHVDLATICLKCLRREPGDRYGSTLELRNDIDRYLAGKPVAARPVSAWQRSLYWCMRNRLVTTLALALVLLVSVSVAVMGVLLNAAGEANARLGQQAETSRETIRKLTAQVREIGLNPAQLRTRKTLLSTIATHYAALVDLEPDDADLVRSLAVALFDVGALAQELDGPGPDTRAQFAEARARFLTFQELAPDRADEVEFDLFHCERRLIQPEAAFERIRKLVQASPRELVLRDALGNQSLMLADFLRAEGRYAEALAACRAGARVYEELCAEHGRKSRYLRHVGTSHYYRGRILSDQSRFDEAAVEFASAIAVQTEFLEAHTDAVDFYSELVQSYRLAARVAFCRGRHGDAAGLLDQALPTCDLMREQFPLSHVSWAASAGVVSLQMALARMTGRDDDFARARTRLVTLMKDEDSPLTPERRLNGLALAHLDDDPASAAELSAVRDLEAGFADAQINWALNFVRGRVQTTFDQLAESSGPVPEDYRELCEAIRANRSVEPILARIEADKTPISIAVGYHRTVVRSRAEAAVRAYTESVNRESSRP